MGIPVERIHWGSPAIVMPRRTATSTCALRPLQNARSHFYRAVQGAIAEKFVEQASWLPYRIDERGRYQMTPADKMKSDGIKSPDISDNCCFAFLLDYIPAEDGQKATVERDRFLELARARLGE